MMKSFTRCAVCGKVGDRDEMVLYHFPDGPKLVCKKCYKELPPDPADKIITPDKRKPDDDFFPPVQ
ncbi:MAG: hypothetical protein GF308_17145 [Candidatus Heimdallarchaeota archaeon]|nr:hypothetical protein [Candidatus Heimdallarchaeota archaeon]